MRILYVAHDFFPHFYGGTERYILNLSKQMQRMGHSVTVLSYGLEELTKSFTTNKKGILRKSYVYEGVPVISVRHLAIPDDIGFIIDDENMENAIKEIIKDKMFDIMHIAHPMRMACCYKAAQKQGIPVILTLTDFWLICPRGRFFKPDYSLCNSPENGKKCIKECEVNPSILKRYKDARRLFEDIDILISPSKFLMGIYKSQGWNRNIFRIKHGVDFKYAMTKTSKKRDNGEIVFGYTGVVTRFKGVNLLLEAFKEVKSPDIRLKIYGNCVWDPEFNRELNIAVEKDKRVQLMGRYEHYELPRIMREIDIMVVPSTTLESYGLVVVESMAFGIPVIASDIVGAAYEYIKNGENGFIFPVNNPSMLKDIIESISKNHTTVKKLSEKTTLPPRIEEEAFMVESIYKRLF